MGNLLVVQYLQVDGSVNTLLNLVKEDNMEWITIYITGLEGFKKEISRKLEHASLHYMPGYMGNASDNYDMYWLDKDTALRLFKETIGAKIIWKYRIRFYDTLEKFIASQYQEVNTSLTQKDIALMDDMRKTA